MCCKWASDTLLPGWGLTGASGASRGPTMDLPGNGNKAGMSLVVSGASPDHGAGHGNLHQRAD